jgi:hypothetical protein
MMEKAGRYRVSAGNKGHLTAMVRSAPLCTVPIQMSFYPRVWRKRLPELTDFVNASKLDLGLVRDAELDGKIGAYLHPQRWLGGREGSSRRSHSISPKTKFRINFAAIRSFDYLKYVN